MESRLSIGNVLSGTFGTIGSNLLATLGLSFLIGVLPTLIFNYIVIGTATLNAQNMFATSGGIAIYFAVLALSVFCSMLVQATLVRVTVAHMRQEKVSIGASLTVALAKLLPLLGVTILATLGVGLGFVLLVVPGIILAIMWCVASPALVAEDLGVFEALARSRELSKGNRWRIFGLFLLLLVVLWALSLLMGLVLFGTGVAGDLAVAAAAGSLPIGYVLVTAVVNTLSTAFSGTLFASLYLELRTAQEGPLTDALADVFA